MADWRDLPNNYDTAEAITSFFKDKSLDDILAYMKSVIAEWKKEMSADQGVSSKELPLIIAFLSMIQPAAGIDDVGNFLKEFIADWERRLCRDDKVSIQDLIPLAIRLSPDEVVKYGDILKSYPICNDERACNIAHFLMGQREPLFPYLDEPNDAWVIFENVGFGGGIGKFDTILIPHGDNTVSVNIMTSRDRVFLKGHVGQPTIDQVDAKIEITIGMSGKIILAYKNRKDIEPDVVQDLIEILNNAKKKYFSS